MMMMIHRRDQTMTALLTGIVVVLVICHLPKAIMNVYECYQVETMMMMMMMMMKAIMNVYECYQVEMMIVMMMTVLIYTMMIMMIM